MTRSKWTDKFLNDAKQQGDDFADILITKIIEEHSVEKANEVLQYLTEDAQPIPEDLPVSLQEYLTQTSHLPDWADEQKISQAQAFFSARGGVFGVALLCGSLPILYAGGLGGAQVLAATGQLANHYQRRAGETLRFILDVMKPHGLTAKGKGIRTIQKVRLMHAAIRYYASRSPEKWPAKPDWGDPINQEELIGTLLAFSTMALKSVEKMNIEVQPEEKEAYLHTWTVIGHLLGIQSKMFPDNMQDAQWLWDKIAERNFMRTDAGLLLGQAHLTFLKKVIPGDLFDGIAISLMRYLMGRKVTEKYLGYPKPGWTSLLIGVLRFAFGLKERLIDSSRTLQQIAEEDSIRLMEGLDELWLTDDSKPFRIPPSLTQK